MAFEYHDIKKEMEEKDDGVGLRVGQAVLACAIVMLLLWFCL
jgi:hypothetical protein